MKAPRFPRRTHAHRTGRLEHRMPILQAVCEHGIGLVVAGSETRRFGPPSAVPFVVILEDRSLTGGPGSFDLPSLQAVLAEVHGVVVLTGKPVVGPYDLTAALLRRGVSTLMVETTRAHGQAWRGLVHAWAPLLPVVVLP